MNGHRRTNHGYLDIDLHISTLLFTTFVRFEGISFFRYLSFEFFIMNDFPSFSSFISSYYDVKGRPIKKFFFSVFFYNVLKKFSKSLLNNLFSVLLFESTFYLNVVRLFFFKFEAFFNSFLDSFVFFYKSSVLNYFEVFFVHYFFNILGFLLNSFISFRFVFSDFFFLIEKKLISLASVYGSVYKFNSTYLFSKSYEYEFEDQRKIHRFFLFLKAVCLFIFKFIFVFCSFSKHVFNNLSVSKLTLNAVVNVFNFSSVKYVDFVFSRRLRKKKSRKSIRLARVMSRLKKI